MQIKPLSLCAVNAAAYQRHIKPDSEIPKLFFVYTVKLTSSCKNYADFEMPAFGTVLEGSVELHTFFDMKDSFDPRML